MRLQKPYLSWIGVESHKFHKLMEKVLKGRAPLVSHYIGKGPKELSYPLS
jgi:hypothetical protein